MRPRDTELMPVLHKATDAELDPLVGYITKNVNNSLKRKVRYQMHQPVHSQYTDLIAQELRAFGGNTVVNVFRGGGPQWKTVVIDVAGKLDAHYERSWPVERIELAVLAAITRKAWEKMDAVQRKALLDQMDLTKPATALFPEESLMQQLGSSRFSSLLLSSLIANLFASQILGRSLFMAAASFISARGVAAFLGPVGWVITGLWTAFDLTGPAYRLTVPAVAHIALLRQRVHAAAEVDVTWQAYHHWQEKKKADSWAAALFRMVGLSTAASLQRERDAAFAQGHAAGQMQATEDYAEQVLQKMDEIKKFEARCEALLSVAFAYANEQGISPARVSADIETCCLGMMSGHLPPALQNTINRLIATPPALATAIDNAIRHSIAMDDIDALLILLGEAFQQTTAA